MGNRVTQCEWRHAPEARGGFGEFLKKSVCWELDTERDGGLSLACGDLCGGCHTCCGGERGRWKSQNRKIVPLSLCWRTFKLKGNKKARTWTKKSLRVFRISRFLCSMYICNERPMYISNIRAYGYGTYRPEEDWVLPGMFGFFV